MAILKRTVLHALLERRQNKKNDRGVCSCYGNSSCCLSNSFKTDQNLQKKFHGGCEGFCPYIHLSSYLYTLSHPMNISREQKLGSESSCPPCSATHQGWAHGVRRHASPKASLFSSTILPPAKLQRSHRWQLPCPEEKGKASTISTSMCRYLLTVPLPVHHTFWEEPMRCNPASHLFNGDYIPIH